MKKSTKGISKMGKPDKIEYGFKNKIPLGLFGFLY